MRTSTSELSAHASAKACGGSSIRAGRRRRAGARSGGDRRRDERRGAGRALRDRDGRAGPRTPQPDTGSAATSARPASAAISGNRSVPREVDADLASPGSRGRRSAGQRGSGGHRGRPARPRRICRPPGPCRRRRPRRRPVCRSGARAPRSRRGDHRAVARHLAQGGGVQVVVMGVRHEHRVEPRQVAHAGRGTVRRMWPMPAPRSGSVAGARARAPGAASSGHVGQCGAHPWSERRQPRSRP